MKRWMLMMALALTAVLLSCEQHESEYAWRPHRPVEIIVPWAAGGSTDQMSRVVARELEQALRQRVVVINQPGASGALGTRTVLHAKADGTTWVAGAAASIGTYPVLNLLDTSLEDWHLFMVIANVPIIGVSADAPWQTFEELLADFRQRGESITVATAGIATSGHATIELIAEAADIKYRHVTYDGGNPAVIATVAGETMVTTQLASEQASMIRGKRIRPLAAYSDQPLELEGYGTIPPITDFLPNIRIAPDYFGIWMPREAPAEVVETMEQIWRDRIADSEAIRRYAREQGALVMPYYGQEAYERGMIKVRSDAWMLHKAGQAAVAPDTLGIERP